MIDYDYRNSLGEATVSAKIKSLFNGLDINAEVDSVRDRLDTLNGGSDKLTWSPENHPDVILKLAEGTQIKQVPVDLLKVFEQFYEYVLPTPVEYHDIVFYRVQVQRKLTLFDDEPELYFPSNKIKMYVAHKGLDKTFLKFLSEKYGEQFVIDFSQWNMETGINSSNWGLTANNEPKIFDYGAVRNEKWKEIALIRDGFYYENGEVKTEL